MDNISSIDTIKSIFDTQLPYVKNGRISDGDIDKSREMLNRIVFSSMNNSDRIVMKMRKNNVDILEQATVDRMIISKTEQRIRKEIRSLTGRLKLIDELQKKFSSV